MNNKYAKELTRTMEWLGKKANTLFIGQAVEYPGTAMSGTLKNVNKKNVKRNISFGDYCHMFPNYCSLFCYFFMFLICINKYRNCTKPCFFL